MDPTLFERIRLLTDTLREYEHMKTTDPSPHYESAIKQYAAQIARECAPLVEALVACGVIEVAVTTLDYRLFGMEPEVTESGGRVCLTVDVRDAIANDNVLRHRLLDID